jgi:type IX secretion system PorP/SprF family membrane protein
MLLQFQGNAPASFDVNVITKYKNMYWGGISYRYQDAVVIILGIDWNKFTFAYSYDITTSDIRKYSGGSHEFTFGYALDGKGMKFLDGLVRKRSSYE